MEQKVSDYIADFLVEHGICHGFTVTGGGAMHLNHSFGTKEGLEMIYVHHEQTAAMAAESYARVKNEPALVCVTTGPGGLNALNGVAGAYIDSQPMIVISGQVRYDFTVRGSGDYGLRSLGDQEFDIIGSVSNMTKYCEMVVDPLDISYCLEKALYVCKAGRPGPCWLDIPLNVQSAMIETDQLRHYIPEIQAYEPVSGILTDDLVLTVLDKIKAAKRPVFYAGNGIRISGAYRSFMRLVERLGIPVVTCWDSIDLMPDEHPLYCGRGGIMGDRPGNFAVQNADLIIAVGNRLSVRQVGYSTDTWARSAYVIMVDIDEAELKKPTIHVDLPVWADAGEFIRKMLKKLPRLSEDFRTINKMSQRERKKRALEGKFILRKFSPEFTRYDWLMQCLQWKYKYPVVEKRHYERSQVNVYAFIKELSSRLPESRITVVGNGAACVVGSAAYEIKRGTRFLINSGMASMGYDLPAAIGACVASDKKEIILVTGDGSLQMNIQELQTIISHGYPIRIFVINNNGYHSIRQTQTNYFDGKLTGVGPDSYDLSFPDLEKISLAYGFPFVRIDSMNRLMERKCALLNLTLREEGPVICEVMTSTDQNFEPKAASRRLEDGRMISAPLEDLYPFLSDVELRENMYIPIYKGEFFKSE
ncbi:MAG: thiamine pyrophosphate-binding protein [Lachnospiraceae bacterium]|nr:thiamine pyrophosphate-binding protein [Lachnospiraceae bacterium]